MVSTPVTGSRAVICPAVMYGAASTEKCSGIGSLVRSTWSLSRVTSCHGASLTTSHGMYFWQRSRNAVGRSAGLTPRHAASSLRLPAIFVTTGSEWPSTFS
ncbi:hypothetical protein D3C83_68010 [compost metagenome]